MASNPPQRTRIAAYSIIMRGDEILLVRTSPGTHEPGQWTLPGGALDFGEDPAAAAVREAREETGFDVALGRVLGVFSSAFDSEQASHHNIGIIYSAQIIGGELTLELDGSTDLCQWIALSEVDHLPLVPLARFAVALAVTASSG